MLKPKKGDRVLVECVVTQEECGTVFPRVLVNLVEVYIQPGLIKQILPPEPKIGDTVWWDKDKFNGESPLSGKTLLYIHQNPGDDRKWGVVAFRGDVPESVLFSRLRKTQTACAA